MPAASRGRVGFAQPGIDAVHAMNDAKDLYDYAISYRNPPEARLFAAAKVQAIGEARRVPRGEIDLALLKYATVGLDDIVWTETGYYFAVGTPQALAPGVRQTLDPRSEDHRRRMKAAYEQYSARRRRDWEARRSDADRNRMLAVQEMLRSPAAVAN